MKSIWKLPKCKRCKSRNSVPFSDAHDEHCGVRQCLDCGNLFTSKKYGREK